MSAMLCGLSSNYITALNLIQRCWELRSDPLQPCAPQTPFLEEGSASLPSVTLQRKREQVSGQRRESSTCGLCCPC